MIVELIKLTIFFSIGTFLFSPSLMYRLLVIFISFIYGQLDILIGRIEEKVIEERPTPLKVVKKWFYSGVEWLITSCPTDWEEIFELVLLSTFFFSITFLSIWTIRKIFSNTILRLKGIQVCRGEAMRAGSSFIVGSRPSYQVPIYVEGLFSPVFIGYGIRYRDILVLPNHVYQDAVASDGGLILGENKKLMIMPLDVKVSDKVSDVTYVSISANIWARLGVSVARVAKTEKSASVSVFGPKGTSTGLVKKSKTPYLLEYSGSTVNGYSGAAYTIVAGWYGMHLGVVGGVNTGVSAEAVAREVDRMFFGESRRRVINAGSSDADSPYIEVSDNDWSASSIVDDEDLYDLYRSDPAARDKSYDQWLDMHKERSNEFQQAIASMDRASLAMLVNLVNERLRQQPRPSTSNYTPQSDVEPSFTSELQVTVDPADDLSQIIGRIEVLERKVTKLESYVSRPTVPAKQKNIKCTVCESTFATELGMMQHRFVVHSVLESRSRKAGKKPAPKFESAIPTDSQILVKTQQNSFLAKGQSTPKSGPNLIKSSNSLLGPEKPSLKPHNQSSTENSLEELKLLLNGLVKVTAGLQEVLKQS